jgi:hypothetical protein
MTRPRRPLPSPKRKRLDSREDTVITSLALPRGLHRQARMAALNLNWTLARSCARRSMSGWCGIGPSSRRAEEVGNDRGRLRTKIH